MTEASLDGLLGIGCKTLWRKRLWLVLQNLAAGEREGEREAVATALPRFETARMEPLRPYVLAAWHKEHPGENVGVFRQAWAENARTLAELAQWVKIPELDAELRGVRRLAPDEEALRLAVLFAVQWDDVRSARAALSLRPWDSESTRTYHAALRNASCAALRAWGADGTADRRRALQPVLDAMEQLPAETALLETPFPASIELLHGALLLHLRTLVDSGASELAPLAARVTAAAPSRVPSFDFGGADRERDDYEHQTVAVREERAAAVLEAFLKVAVALAAKKQETFDPGPIRSDAVVAGFCTGAWATQYALLRALRQALSVVAPTTVQRLSEVRAFHEPHADWRKLWIMLPELGASDPSQLANVLPAREVVLLGQRGTVERLLAEAGKGPLGDVGKLIKRHVVDTLDFAALRANDRTPVAPAGGCRHHGKGASGKMPSTKESKAERDLRGLWGEIYVYEQFQHLLPDFSDANWVSENRREYGLQGPAADDEGFDFRYRDASGALCGQPGTLCKIEVKSSVEGAPQEFYWSSNQWTKALEAHDSDDEMFVVVLVGAVDTSPHIADILLDPAEMAKDGTLLMDAREFKVFLGSRAVAAAPAAEPSAPAAA